MLNENGIEGDDDTKDEENECNEDENNDGTKDQPLRMGKWIMIAVRMIINTFEKNSLLMNGMWL